MLLYRRYANSANTSKQRSKWKEILELYKCWGASMGEATTIRENLNIIISSHLSSVVRDLSHESEYMCTHLMSIWTGQINKRATHKR